MLQNCAYYFVLKTYRDIKSFFGGEAEERSYYTEEAARRAAEDMAEKEECINLYDIEIITL